MGSGCVDAPAVFGCSVLAISVIDDESKRGKLCCFDDELLQQLY